MVYFIITLLSFPSIYLIFMLNKLNFVNLLRKTKQNAIFFHFSSIATLFF